MTCTWSLQFFFDRKFQIAFAVTCGIIVNFERKSLSPISDISKPSISILPPEASSMRNKASAIEDLPAPVRPTIPTYKL